MPRKPFSHREKIWLIGTLVLCALPLGTAVMHQKQNAEPEYHFKPRVLPSPNAEKWILGASLSYKKFWSKARFALGVDPLVSTDGETPIPKPYSPQYNHFYLLPRKTAFLDANAKALNQLSTGLSLPYAYSGKGFPLSTAYWYRFLDIARLLVVKARAEGQSGDANAAASTLIDAYHLACIIPKEAPLSADPYRFEICALVRSDLNSLAPHLKADELRRVAREINHWNSQVPPLADSLEWEKRAQLETLKTVIGQNDLRPLYTRQPVSLQPWGCADLRANACGLPPGKMQSDMEALPPTLQLRLSWLNKKRLVDNVTANMDRNIAGAKRPFAEQMQLLVSGPVTDQNDWLEVLQHQGYQTAAQNYAVEQAAGTLFVAQFALRAYRMEHGRNPASLRELVPGYLAELPLDPMTDGQPLRYRDKALRFKSLPQAVDATQPTAPTYSWCPFTLYSVGLNMRDDGGTPGGNWSSSYNFSSYWSDPTSGGDIVAGANNF
jgi:hypothetical protein